MFKNFNLKEVLSLPLRINISLLVACGVLLFMPDEIMKKLYLKSFLDKYGFYIGILFTLTFSLVIFTILGHIFVKIKNKYLEWKSNKDKYKLLNSLNDNEKFILFLFYQSDSNTLYLPPTLGTVAKLRSFGMITPTTTQFIVDMRDPKYPFLMQPWVYDCIDENYDKYFESILNELEEDNENSLQTIISNLSHYNAFY